VSFGGFDCCFLFVVGGAGNELKSILLTFFSHLSNPTPNLYVDLVAHSSTLLKSSSMIFAQNGFLKMRSQISDLLLKLRVLFGSMDKLTLERDTHFTRRG
jgi:hypothetical protein